MQHEIRKVNKIDLVGIEDELHRENGVLSDLTGFGDASDKEFYALYDGDRIVAAGCISFSEISRFYVSQKYRKQGVGRELAFFLIDNVIKTQSEVDIEGKGNSASMFWGQILNQFNKEMFEIQVTKTSHKFSAWKKGKYSEQALDCLGYEEFKFI